MRATEKRKGTVRAVVCDRYGPPEVLRIEEVARPVPKDDEVLVRVHAATVNRSDSGLRSAEYFFTRVFTGLRRPKQRILGMELAGEVEAVGAAVTEFNVGDRVFGIGSGANADFVCARESSALAHMPADMTFDEAASVCDGACTALSFLKQVKLRDGQKIAIYGASGSIGTASVQLAMHLGAEVTAVCNTKNLEVVRSLGADHVVDYLQEDFTKNGDRYNVILDAVGKHSAMRCRRSLTPGGIYLTAGSPGSIGKVLILALLTKWIGSRKVKLGIAAYRKDDVLFLKELIEAGNYRAVVDRCYPLEDVVEAHRYVDTQQKTGNVVLTVNDGRT
jgi:NADPH:quinone reductase-like Zn-dependent oxidoreductase